MEKKKENPPQRKSFPFATVIAVLTGITSLLIFLTGKTNLPEILNIGSTDTPTLTATLTNTPVIPASPTVEKAPPTPTPTFTLVPSPAQLKAEPPTDADLEKVPSIWTMTDFHELAEPGSNAYTIEITHDSAWLWDCYFCTTDETFHDFLSTLEVEFLVDRVRLGDEFIRIFDRPGTKGWICRNWSTKLTGWPQDKSVFLEIHYIHSKKTSDGKDEFAAGDYSQTIVVVVRG